MEAIIFVTPTSTEPELYLYDDNDNEALKKYIECADEAEADYSEDNVSELYYDELTQEVTASLTGSGYQLFWKVL